MDSIRYPSTREDDVVDDHHGTAVADPYRWLEDLDAADTAAWVEAQNTLTFGYLDAIPMRDELRARLTELWDYEKYSQPFKAGGRYFVMRNDGLQNQFVLHAMDALDGEARVLLDPNAWSEDGTIALSGLAFTRDGSLLAYGKATAGSDWNEWHVVDVATGEALDDHIRWVKFSGAAWLPDNSGFFYSRYDPKQKLEDQNFFQKLYLHRLGTPQEDDVLVYERPDQKEWGFGAFVTEDQRYLGVHVWAGTDPRNRFYYKPLDALDGPMIELLDDFDAEYTYVGNDGPLFYFVTDLNAPRRRVIAIDVTAPERARWREVIPESDDVLESVTMKGDRFIARFLRHARSHVAVYELDGAHLHDVPLPGIGTAAGFGGRRDDPETFFTFTAFTAPATIFRYDAASNDVTLWRRSAVAFDADAFETKQVFYTSADGTQVPMFVTHRKGLVLDGNNPTYLYGYGGFNISMTPAFSLVLTAWMERGGVFAVANIRGGGEYGESWHQAGSVRNKQNTFDDFIAAAEWLIANGYTRPERLAAVGGSNGGLLVGACITQRPDLFGAASINVGVLDMLRFHRFTIGWGWVSDYGSPDDPEDFKVLYAYSPLHNVRAGVRYPATLVSTADHDDRVVPSHSYKFVAALQKAQAGPSPVLIRVDVRAGHGVGKPTTKVIEKAADELAFLLHNLGAQ